MDERLHHRLRAVARRYRSLRLWNSLAVVWLLAAIVGGVLLWLNTRSPSILPAHVFTLGLVAVAIAALVTLLAVLSFRSPSWAVQRLERQFPDLDQRLITAIAQRPSPRDGSYGYLQQTVLDETLTHARRRRWESAVSEAQLARARWLNLPALLLFALVLTGLWTQRGPAVSVAEGGIADRGPQSGARVVVEPGNMELPRGSRLTVFARFSGIVPKEAALVATSEQGVERIPMTRSLNDPLFGGQIFEIMEDIDYYVEFAGDRSETYRVTVFEYPRLVRADAKILYPAYTEYSEKLIEDTRRVSAVEGSELTWLCHLNKPVKEAVLVDQEGEKILLSPDSATPLRYNTYAASIRLTESRRWTLKLVDEDGRANEFPPQLVATVVPNKAPEIKLALARDLRVSPLEEIPVQASFQDDFGLVKSGLTYTLAGESHDVVLSPEASERQTRHEATHLLDFEALQAEPDQLLSYYFWAEDLVADGQPRRTSSDMFFAEVRHFEEIFREGQPPPGGQSQQQQQGQGQNAQAAEQLAEVQKQIITATWNIIRRETENTLTNSFAGDVTLLRDSQAKAIELLEALAERVSDGESQGYIEDVRSRMQEAVDLLTAAADGPAKDPLTPALAAEQAAYQGLLRLRAREHEVVRGQQQQGGGGSSSSSSARFQQQLQELQIQNNENRYETERQAQAPAENDEQREMRQVLNRLRELAQRQQDLNEQLQQLQTALQQAETQEEREEIERQLKRLRDQQEEMLRDTDELAQRMSEARNQSEMQQPREQVQETRENVRQSAEALSEQNVSQALSAGTRAERQFEQMRDEFCRRTANQFSEDMQQLRDQARALDEEQQKIGEQLADLQQESRGSLRGDGNRQQLRDQLGQQQQDLEDLLNRMQETVQNAESSEPLLAESLYDAVREARQQQLSERLQGTGELLRNGMDSEAQQLEQTAREGVSNLRQNIDEAAEEVLGDETEALQRALTELEQLSRELNQEIEREDPRPTEPGESHPGRGRSTDDQRTGDGQESQNDRQSDQQPSSEGQPSDSGEGQPGPRGQSNNARQPQQVRQPSGEPRGGQGQPSGQEQSTDAPPSSEESQTADQSDQQQESGSQESSESPGQSGEANQSGRQSPRGGQGGGRGDSDRQQGTEAGNPFDPDRASELPGGQREGAQYDGGGLGIDRFGGDSLGSAPLTGDSFREWSDRMRDVEEIVGDPELRSEAARIRERARDIRREFRRGSRPPQWPLVRRLVAEPLEELKERVAEELLRRSAEKNALVPIDRDPVPDQFTEQVRRYYERLGSGD